MDNLNKDEMKEMEVEVNETEVNEANVPEDNIGDVDETADFETGNDDVVTPGDDEGILRPEEMIGDRSITDPNGIAPQPGQNVDKQLGGNTVGLMDVLAGKAEQGVKGDANKELEIDQQVDDIIAEINAAMGIHHEPDNSNRNEDNPYAEKIGGTNIAETGSNAAADALNERINSHAKVEYSATGEPENLGEYMKSQKNMQDGTDLYGSGENETEVINDKVEVQPNTYKSDYGNGLDEMTDGNPTGDEEGANIPEFSSGEGDAENRKFEAGSELKATEDEEEDFVPEDKEDSDDEEEYDEDDNDDSEEEEEFEEPEDNDEFEDDENGEGSVVSSDDNEFNDEDSEVSGSNGEVTATVAPGADTEIRSLSDLENRETVSGNIEVNPDLYKDENQEIVPINTSDNSSRGLSVGNNGDDMVDTNKYEDQGEVNKDQSLAQVVGTTDGKYSDGMNDDCNEPGEDIDSEAKYDVNVPYGLGGSEPNSDNSDIDSIGDSEDFDNNDFNDSDNNEDFNESNDESDPESISEESVSPFDF